MLGTIVNALAILVGGLLGLLFKKGIPERINETIMNGLALCVMFIGISGVLKVNSLLLVIFSIAIGAIIGELTDIDRRLKNLGDSIEKRLNGKGGSVSQGFVTTSLLYCIGAMAIVGSLESGLTGNHKTLFAKSIIDGISSIVFTSSLGIGAIFSSVSVFIYQGAITLAASSLSGILVDTVINDMNAIGSLLIIGISLNMLNVTKIRVANLLPGVFIPIIYQLITSILEPTLHMIGK